MSRVLVVLLALTVLGAQVIGMQRGFLCDDHHTTEHSCPEHEEHAPFKEALEADQAVKSTVSAPLAVLMPLFALSVRLENQAERLMPREYTHSPPLWPPRLIRSISLRI